MCGIVGAATQRNVTSILLQGLRRLEYRGYDSSGLAVLDDQAQLKSVRKVGKVEQLGEALEARPLRGSVGIAHTRWATHGLVSEQNAHPHSSNDRVCLVHNGIIENHSALRDEMLAAGYTMHSDTDSEVIVHLIDSYIDQGLDLLEAVRAAIRRLRGAFAIAVINAGDPDRIIAARLGCPLIIGKGIGENFLASDVLALRLVTDRFIHLEEGDLVDLRPDEIAIWNAEDESVVRTDVHVTLGEDDTDRGEYRHFMQKEIYQQPQVVRDVLDGRVTKERVLEAAFGLDAGAVFDKTRAVTIVACGTSFYAGRIARYWIEELVGVPCQVEVASEYRYRKSAILADSLFITLSQSGETADTLAALRSAKTQGYLSTLTLCNVPTSTMARESDLVLMLNAGSEISVASTKAFVAQLVAFATLTLLLARRHGLTPEKEAEIVGALHDLPKLLTSILQLDQRISGFAEHFVDKHHALFLGRGSLYPLALEGALKLKELTYIHAEGYAAGELKHGPLALVDEAMPVVAIAPNDQLLEKLQSNLQEVRARGGKLFVFVESGSRVEITEDIRTIELPSCHPMLAPIAYVLPLQLLAYHVGVFKGTDVDQPRNLAKSVTVE